MLRRLLQGLSGLGLVLTVAPSWLVFAGRITWEMHADLMLVGTALWFATAPFWMRSKADML
ncbi:hypothetical protein [Rhodothermus marinus]|uniref:Uncharacterized protein n=1 Tax=Rhodothermus marinus (strain ATCC 43812 / DSM 4252 / R-10) TaxID=518766 RepID=D0MFR2_RHOM4|nr:hypothetical protein [Rhodothermus marinus]ACY47589.1 hypothetical protein Rmar_0691 [Rhodothermus marinus DSM 4252]AEN74093.1 hypothetical protein Rhom172_2192 [Rhodothermus marinus SG0.5JP17-172]MBO2490932.1 hypothetical protein [Rhodothermus marinus]BBM71853.1 hypothetical protein RmaAA338_07180 [Rhodothermus marinus]